MDKIILETIDEYRELYKKEYLDTQVFSYDNILVEFKSWHFDHIFFRNKWLESNPKFDRKTAQAIMQIKSIITWEIQNIEIYEQYNQKGKRKERSLVLLCNWLYVVLWFSKRSWTLYPITAYHKSRWDIKKFKKTMMKHQLF